MGQSCVYFVSEDFWRNRAIANHTRSRIFNGINSCVLYVDKQKTKARYAEELGDRVPRYF